MTTRLSMERLVWGPMGRCVICEENPAVGTEGHCLTCLTEIRIGWDMIRFALADALAPKDAACPACEADDIHFDRSLCACGVMHYYCTEGHQTDPCKDAA